MLNSMEDCKYCILKPSLASCCPFISRQRAAHSGAAAVHCAPPPPCLSSLGQQGENWSGAVLALTFYFVMRLYASFFFTLPLLVGGALKAQVHYYLGASLPCLLLIFCQSSLLHCNVLLPHNCQKLANLF